MISLEVINEAVKECKRCDLSKHCNQIVPGIGPSTSPLLIVLETPDGEDDIFGEPLSGRRGDFFKKILSTAGYTSKEFYITNMVKCKTNKLQKVNIVACKHWLWQELQIINPKIVIAMGKTVVELLLRKKGLKLGDIAGKIQEVDYMSASIIPWYSLNNLLTKGTASDKETIGLFAKIKENI